MQSGPRYKLTYEDGAGRLVMRDADTGAVSWTARPPVGVRELAWSAAGTRLLAVGRSRALLYDADGRLTAVIAAPPEGPILDGALSPDGHALALVRGGTDNDVVVATLVSRRRPLRRVLSAGGLRQLSWSPDGRWLLVSSAPADQSVLRTRVGQAADRRGVARIARQFAIPSRAPAFPHIDGWCCTADGRAG